MKQNEGMISQTRQGGAHHSGTGSSTGESAEGHCDDLNVLEMSSCAKLANKKEYHKYLEVPLPFADNVLTAGSSLHCVGCWAGGSTSTDYFVPAGACLKHQLWRNLAPEKQELENLCALNRLRCAVKRLLALFGLIFL